MDTIPERDFPPISRQELLDAVEDVSGQSSPGADHLRWPYIAALVHDTACGDALRRIFQACVEKAYWPIQFKEAVSVVIPKPKKDDYSRLKAYRPVVLLSCLGKLFEKVIAARMHY
ncbi:hypothetical protein PYCCODRAFT_1350443, partial [Trametes coccinea BRFM310]